MRESDKLAIAYYQSVSAKSIPELRRGDGLSIVRKWKARKDVGRTRQASVDAASKAEVFGGPPPSSKPACAAHYVTRLKCTYRKTVDDSQDCGQLPLWPLRRS